MKFSGFSTSTKPKPSINIVPPSLTGTVIIGNSPIVNPGTWSKSGDNVYSLYRDNVSIKGYDKVSKSTIESYQYSSIDIGPDISVKEFSLIGGMSASSGPIEFPHATYLSESAIWVSSMGLTTEVSGGVVVAKSWQSSFGGLSVTLSSSDINRQPLVMTGVLGNPAPQLIFDGVDDEMHGTITKGSTWNAGEWAIVGSRVLFGTLGDVIIGHATAAGGLRYALRDRTANSLYNGSGVGTYIGTTDPDNRTERWWGQRDATTTYAAIGYRDTTDVSSNVASINAYADGEDVIVGGLQDGTTATNIRVQAIDTNSLLTSDQRLHLRALLSYWTGVAC